MSWMYGLSLLASSGINAWSASENRKSSESISRLNRDSSEEIARLSRKHSAELQYNQLKFSVLQQRENQEFQRELAELNHERAKEIEAFRAKVSHAINQKNLDFQKWRFEQEKKIQYDILQLQQDFQRDLVRLQHQNAVELMRERLRSDKSPIANLPFDLLENSFAHGVMPLKLFLAPPFLDHDPSTGKPLTSGYETYLAEEIEQFLHQGYLVSHHHPVQLVDRAWESKKWGGSSALQALHGQLKSIPVLVLESDINLGDLLNFKLGYWSAGDVSYTKATILSGQSYSDLLYSIAKNRALEWEKTRQKLQEIGKDEAFIKEKGGLNEENLQILYKELAEKAEFEEHGLDLTVKKDYKLSNLDYRAFYQYLAVWHCLVIGLYADILFLGNSWENTPLLPSLIPYLLEKYKNHPLLTPEFWQEGITTIVKAYGRFYDSLESDAGSSSPEIRMKLALSLANLPDAYKYLALEQGSKAFSDWLRSNNVPSDKVFDLDNDRDCQTLKQIIYQEDKLFLESLKLLSEKVKSTDKIDANQSASINRLLVPWDFLTNLSSSLPTVESEKQFQHKETNSRRNDTMDEEKNGSQNSSKGEPTMNNNNENQQVDPILKNLQNIFSDRPEVLRLLDPSNLDLDRVAGEVVLENYRNQEGFSSPINLYVTGKTRAGKTSLGNTLLGGKQTAMKSTGYTDCTDKVNCFKLANNLRYFDLPGAGSDETFENINRAALCIEQIDEENCRVTEFILSDYTDYQNTKKAQEETISVEKWQSQDNQLELGADVILYVVAAHEGMGRDDEVYLGSLLYLQKEKRDSCNVIFALNLHLDENDRPMYRKQYIEDAYKRITKVYKKVYGDQNTEPIIIEINSIKGIGADKIAEEICKLLPVHKLGKMEEVLGEKLKEKARITRSKRFHEALIYIAIAVCSRMKYSVTSYKPC